MSESEYKTTISQKAEEVFRQPSIPFRADLKFRDIPGFDSVLAIQYILTIEEALGITLNEEQVDIMYTMGDLLDMVKAQKG